MHYYVICDILLQKYIMLRRTAMSGTFEKRIIVFRTGKIHTKDTTRVGCSLAERLPSSRLESTIYIDRYRYICKTSIDRSMRKKQMFAS